MDRLRLTGIRLFVRAGSTEAEREAGHHLSLDVEVAADLQAAGEADALEATIDYSRLHDAVEAAVAGEEYTILEAVAEDAARAAADALSHPADEVVVRVRKPRPPVPGATIDHAEVEVRRDLPLD